MNKDKKVKSQFEEINSQFKLLTPMLFKRNNARVTSNMVADSIHHRSFQGSLPDILKVALLASILVVFSLWLQGDILLCLSDEGFLWYGTWRTALGDVPLRDFQSYDPGRYYWTAGWSMALGNGVMALRKSVGIFQVLGLTFGLLTLRRIIRSWWILAIAGVLLLVWMHPRCKIIDHSISMTAVYFAALLTERPSLRRHFAAGVFVGVAAFFGRNHGFYGFVSFFLLISFIWLKIDRSDFFRRICAWGAGIVVGYSPMFFMVILFPGFFDSIIKSIMFLFRIKFEFLPLPVPWPWTVDFLHIDIMGASKSISTGVFFLMLPAFYVLAGVYLICSKYDFSKKLTPLVASVFVGAAYMHYAFSRADVSHLALGIHPLLIGLLSLPFLLRATYKRIIGAALVSVVFIMSYFSVVTASPYYIKVTAPEGRFVKVEVHGDSIWVSKYRAHSIKSVIKIDTQMAFPGEEMLIAPFRPGFYALLERKSPLWDIYFLFRETEERQNHMISELKEKNVNWVLLYDVAIDGRDDRRFQNTHNLLWRHLMDDFETVRFDGLPGKYRLLKRKQP